MRGLHWVKPVALAAIALGACALTAVAQETMKFRPLPAESVARLESGQPATTQRGPRVDIDVPDRAGRRFQVHVDSSGGFVNMPGANAPPLPPTPPSSTGEPSPPSTEGRESTSDIVRFGSDVTVSANQVVEGDVVSMGGSVRVDGVVRGSVTAMGGDITLGPGARVDRDVVCFGGTLHEDPTSSIGGQRVTGRMPGSHPLLFWPVLSMVGTGVRVMTLALMLAFMLAVAFVFVKLAPGRTQAALDMVRTEGMGSFLVGLLLWGLLIPSVVVLALVMIVLCITIIGIPLALAVVLAWAAFIVLAAFWGAVVGYAVLGGTLHHRLRAEPADLMRAAAWGIVAIYGLRIVGALFHVVPFFGFVGGLFKFVAVTAMFMLGTLGAGALVRAEYRRRTLQDW